MKGILFILLTISCQNLHGQSISDLEFSWKANDSCQDLNFTGEIFQVVEHAPQLLYCTSARLSNILDTLSDILNLGVAIKGDISVKLQFFPGKSICVRSLGTKGLELTELETDLVMDFFYDFVDFVPCKQGNEIRNCEGTLYLRIKGGKIHGYGLANFETTGR